MQHPDTVQLCRSLRVLQRQLLGVVERAPHPARLRRHLLPGRQRGDALLVRAEQRPARVRSPSTLSTLPGMRKSECRHRPRRSQLTATLHACMHGRLHVRAGHAAHRRWRSATAAASCVRMLHSSSGTDSKWRQTAQDSPAHQSPQLRERRREARAVPLSASAGTRQVRLLSFKYRARRIMERTPA